MSSPELQAGVEYNRAVMLVNPVSRYADDIQRQEAHFREQLGSSRLHVIQAPDGKRTSAIDTLGKEIKAGDILLSAGGDGQLNLIVNAFTSGQLPEQIAKTPILPLWNGGACDGANSLNSRELRDNPTEILRRGRVITGNVLETNMDLPSGRYWRDSALYAGVGITALYAERVDDRRDAARAQSRLHNSIDDRVEALRTLRDAKSFAIEQTVNGKPVVHSLVELSALRGPIMGEVFRPAVKLDEPEWRLVQLQDKRLITLGSTLGRLCTGSEVGTPVKAKQRVAFKVLNHVLMQFDGEYMAVPADTNIRIISGTRTVRYVTTR